MRDVFLIFPHQLFDCKKYFQGYENFALVEDSLFFGDEVYPIKFHKHKLVLHRSSMKCFARTLIEAGKKVHYFAFAEYRDLKSTIERLKLLGYDKFYVYDPVDYILEKRLRRLLGYELTILESPSFLLTRSEFLNYFSNNKFFLHKFYVWHRKKLGLLLHSQMPVGGKWSFDSENRKKLKTSILIENPPQIVNSEELTEAKIYVDSLFPDNPGNSSTFCFPYTRGQALQWLDFFKEHKLDKFGPYQDAISQRNDFLFHSGLSASINIGLLTVDEILNQVIERKDHAPIQSLEGFIRQIVGWREYVRAMYVIAGTKLRSSNYFNNFNKLGNLRLAQITPLNCCLDKSSRIAYLHHIERLMIVGNFMLLCEIDPHEAYSWFMTHTIDAYDWVMVPNLYGMSQFAAGPLITTKPYFSSSSYLLRMGEFKKDLWSEVWDALFYRFVRKNYNLLVSNARLSALIKNLCSSSKASHLADKGMKVLIDFHERGVLVIPN
ncbi:MAG: cryptochrome/photolyase family protein [Deltaproteobacteria bacterium]|nr:cryptochrome/photolyase family protein [Deltaproteobacteria bacterium]